MKINKFTKWLVPYHYWHHHHKNCGVRYRGCDLKCPKDIYERSNRIIWTGPISFVVYFKRLIRSILGK